MSFALKPIDKRIQKVLERKSKIFSRETSALETVSVGGISDELKKVQSRTTWMRWISGNENPIVILGGVAHYDGAYNLAKGFDQVYVPPNTAIKYNSPSPDGFESRDSSKYFKPLAGVKSISSTFEGATKSLRKIVVNWTVYDLDELEILTPHFLSPGKWTLLEMGWNYADKVFDKKLIGDKLLEQDTNFEDFSSVEDMIYDNEGDYEILTGVIMNFEYSLRDDGGFDCTTTMGTHGISLLDAGKDSTTYNIDKSLKLSDPESQNASTTEVMLKNNLTTTVNRLDSYFRFSCLNPEGTAVVPGKELMETGEGEKVSKFYGEPDNWFMYSSSGSLEKEDGDLPSWVRWGWFEDNVISKFMGYVTLNTDENNKVTGVEDIKLQFRSIDNVLKKNALGIKIKPVEGEENRKKESVRILCHPKMLTSDINKFILVGRTPTLKKAEVSQGLRASHIAQFLEENTDLKPFVIPGSLNNETGFQEAYLRNIYFNVDWLKEQLKGTQTLREGMDNILNGINFEYQNYWDFDITGDENDTTLARIVDRNNPRYNVDNFRLSKINLKREGDSVYSCYQFPTWTKDSIVSNMDYSVTIPSSQVAVAALSGGTLDAEDAAHKGKGDVNVQQFVKIMNKSFEDQEDKFFENIVKISDHFDKSEIEKFGNTSADENEKLEANQGPSILGTVVSRDKELTNSTDGNPKIDQPGTHDITSKSLAKAHDFFMQKSFDEPGAEAIGSYSTLYTGNGKLMEGGGKTYKEQMLKSLHTSRRSAKTKIVDLLNGIAEIKLTIDGTAGIFPGDAFSSKHLPKHLVRLGRNDTLPLLFQATNIEQALGPDGWKTTITGQPRLNARFLYDDVDETAEPGVFDFEIVGNTSYADTPIQQKIAYFEQTKNILGINAHYLNKYQMYLGILRIHKSDPYWNETGKEWSKKFPLGDYGGYQKREEPNCKFDWNNNPNYTDDSKKESYYMAIYDGLSVQKAMWHSMYNAILYGIPPEKSYNKKFAPYTSLDTTFNLMSYLLFVSDDLDPTKPIKRYEDNGQGFARPGYHPEFFDRINTVHFKNKSKLNPNGQGKASKNGVSGLYTPCQWLKAAGLINGAKHLQENVKLTKSQALRYQKLFKFARISPKKQTYEPPGYELFNKSDITCIMRLTYHGAEIYREFFRMLYDNWIGPEFEEYISLTNPATAATVDRPKVLNKFGSMFRNSKLDLQLKEEEKKGGIEGFNFDQEVDKFLTMMTKHGIHLAPLMTMIKSPPQTGDHNAWDVIKETCDEGYTWGGVGSWQKWKTTEEYGALQFQSPGDDECHEIKQKGS